MKKLFLSLLIFVPFLTQAELIDDLDQAIKESNVEQVKILLQEGSPSDADLLPLIELSRDTFSFYKDLLVGFLVKPRIPVKALIAFIGSGYSLCGFFICTGLGLSEIFKTGPGTKNLRKKVLLLWGGGASLISSKLLFKCFIREREDVVDTFNALMARFKNASKVKQLLLRYKPAQ